MVSKWIRAQPAFTSVKLTCITFFFSSINNGNGIRGAAYKLR